MTDINEVLTSLGEGAVDLSGQPQTPKAFIMDTMKRIKEDSVTAGTEDAEVDDDTIENLDRVMFSLGPGLADLEKDEDGRAYDEAKLKVAESSLDEIMESFAAATESLERDGLIEVILQERKLYTQLCYQRDKLSEIKSGIESSHTVSQNTYKTLVNLGVGIENALPAYTYYTKEPSANSLEPTLESVDKTQAAIGAAGALLGLGVIYKIFTWIRKFFKKGEKETTAKVDKALNAAEKVLEKNAGLKTRLDDAIAKASFEDKFQAISSVVKDEKEARNLSDKDSKALISHFTTKLLDSIPGELVDLSTDEGMKTVKEHSAAMLSYTQGLQSSIKQIALDLENALKSNDAMIKPINPPKPKGGLLSSLFSNSSKSRPTVTVEDLVEATRNIREGVGTTDSKTIADGIDNIITQSKKLHEQLAAHGDRVSKSQLEQLTSNIDKVKSTAINLQKEYVVFKKQFYMAGKTMVKVVKMDKELNKVLDSLK